MYRMRDVKVPGGTLEFEAETIEGIWEQATLIASFPMTCPIDGSSTVLDRSEYEGFIYYSVRSVDHPKYSFRYGTRREGKQLYPKGWYEWDEANRCQYFWRAGLWYCVDPKDSTPLFDQPRPGGNGHQAQIQIQNEAQLDATIDAVFSQHSQDWENRYGVFEDAGKVLYGKDWETKKQAFAGAFQAKDVNSLTVPQLDKLIIGMREVQAKRMAVPA